MFPNLYGIVCTISKTLKKPCARKVPVNIKSLATHHDLMLQLLIKRSGRDNLISVIRGSTIDGI